MEFWKRHKRKLCNLMCISGFGLAAGSISSLLINTGKLTAAGEAMLLFGLLIAVAGVLLDEVGQ